MITYLDIETIPSQDPALRTRIEAEIKHPGNMSKPDTIAAWEIEKKPALVDAELLATSFDGAHGHVVSIGFAIDAAEPVVLYSDRPLEDTIGAEMRLLKAFYERWSQEFTHRGAPRDRVFVGHHLLGFDLPFLFKRSVVLQIPPPPYIPFRAKPWSDEVFDTMLRWAGDRGTISQDALLRALGHSGKGEIDGSMVYGLVREGRIAEVAAYNRKDVVDLRFIHRRMTFEAP